MSSVVLASKTFGDIDQEVFARLSGDFNPIHMDALAARKTQAGFMVVHGIHAVLWALDCLDKSGNLAGGVSSLKVQFAKFIPVGSTVHLKLVSRNEHSLRVELALGKLTTTILTVKRGATQAAVAALPDEAREIQLTDRPAVLDHPDQATGLTGWMDVSAASRQVGTHFPHAVAAIGAGRVAAIALLSRLVGMICPGLHSIFAAFEIKLVENPPDPDRLGFSVSGTDERFRMVRMIVSGAGISGSVQTFLRWPPVVQAPLDEIMKLVAPTEFSGSTALVIGGSRGLGALTAKVIAAGGGKVIVTYTTGRQDALHLAEEIHRHFPHNFCQVMPYDARRDAAGQLKHLTCDISHLYYFATTPIARQKEDLFASDLFSEFIQIYVNGFDDCCRALGAHGSPPLTAFYPSSVFVENSPPNMTEYSMAKMAGEILCKSLNHANDRVRVTVSRLPRLKTDQTATVTPVTSAEPLEILLPIIRNVQSINPAP